MKTVEIAGLSFGQGRPKICVPLTERGGLALLREANQALALPADLLEWRADCFFGDPLDVLPGLSRTLEGKPLLCTVRTEGEGGQARLTQEEYQELLTALLLRGGFQLIDVEFSIGRERVLRLVELARSRGIGVVVSKHDFSATPPAKEIAGTLREMKALGADLPKYAVTPQTPEDVLALLEATLQASGEVGPVVTMAMGALGKVSRVCGGLTGSCLTFGAGAAPSAPGQLDAEDLAAILQDLDPWS